MIAFIFPGQGSQKPGMGEPWVGHPSWTLVEQASEATGRDLAHLLTAADAEELRLTQNSQMATFLTAAVALDAVKRLGGLEPGAVAGHSLGEYTALVAAGVLDIAAGAFLVNERGLGMAEANKRFEGTMAAVIGLDDESVERVCAELAREVWVANYNAPGQVVIAGAPADVDLAATRAKEAGAKKVMPLAVSGAFHTPFMAYARGRLGKAIAATELGASSIPVYTNVDAEPHTDAEDWPRLLDTQLCNPVRWSQTLVNMAADGVDAFVELGPGKVLTGTAKRTVAGATTSSVETPEDLERTMEALRDRMVD